MVVIVQLCIWTQDSYRLPEGVKRIAYDADTQRYLFRDKNTGQLYQGPEGEMYGRLQAVDAPIPPSRRVTVSSKRPSPFMDPQTFMTYKTAVHPDPAIRKKGLNKRAATFDDILPSTLIISAESGLPSSPLQRTCTNGLELAKSAVPVVQGVIADVKRRCSLREVRGKCFSTDEKQRFLAVYYRK